MKIPVQQIPFNVYQIHEHIFNTFKSNLIYSYSAYASKGVTMRSLNHKANLFKILLLVCFSS